MNADNRSDITVYLLRHGQTKLNAAGRLRGRTEAALDPAGLAQADALGHLFQGVVLARVIASPLRRTYETATPIAGAAGVNLETDDGFNDRDYGDWTGEPKQDVEARFGSVGDAPGVETWQLLTDRVYAAFLRVTGRASAGSALAIIAHDAVNTALLQRLGLIAGTGPDPKAQNTGCWNKLAGQADHWQLLIYNALPDDGNQP